MTGIAPVEFLWALGLDMILAVSAIVGYGLLRCALITATHRFRVRTGIKADRLAADARAGSQTREQLIAMADIAYHPLAPWLVIVGVAVGLFLPRPVGRRMLEENPVVERPGSLQEYSPVEGAVVYRPGNRQSAGDPAGGPAGRSGAAAGFLS